MKHLFYMNRALFVEPLALGLLILLSTVAKTAYASGDVVIVINPGKGEIILEGDFDNNDITVTQAGDEITIRGNASTKINGENEVKINVKDITGPDDGEEVALEKLKIGLRGGEDTILIAGLSSKKLEIKDDIGNNTTIIQNSAVAEKLKIHHGDGTDTVKVMSTTWGEKDIKTGKGGDTLDIQESAGDKTSADLGAGDDALFADTLISNTIKFKGASGTDCYEFFDVTSVDNPESVTKGFERDECGDGGCTHDPCETGVALALDCDLVVTSISGRPPSSPGPA
jgi:hypothetical protein